MYHTEKTTIEMINIIQNNTPKLAYNTACQLTYYEVLIVSHHTENCVHCFS